MGGGHNFFLPEAQKLTRFSLTLVHTHNVTFEKLDLKKKFQEQISCCMILNLELLYDFDLYTLYIIHTVTSRLQM